MDLLQSFAHGQQALTMCSVLNFDARNIEVGQEFPGSLDSRSYYSYPLDSLKRRPYVNTRRVITETPHKFWGTRREFFYVWHSVAVSTFRPRHLANRPVSMDHPMGFDEPDRAHTANPFCCSSTKQIRPREYVCRLNPNQASPIQHSSRQLNSTVPSQPRGCVER